jgi:YCII-related domain
MNDYILFMHNDATANTEAGSDAAWGKYLAMLKASGRFSGGSSIGAGQCFAKATPPAAMTSHVSGYLRVQAESLEDARKFLEGNPVFESGGTVEIRELPRD